MRRHEFMLLLGGAERHMERRAKIRIAAKLVGSAAPMVFCAAAILLAASPGWAQMLSDNAWKTSRQRWAVMDECKRQGVKAFPDHTAESLRKRDRAVNQCLAANNLPPIAPQAPRPPEGGSSQR
jgi:hypothetical protein